MVSFLGITTWFIQAQFVPNAIVFLVVMLIFLRTGQHTSICHYWLLPVRLFTSLSPCLRTGHIAEVFFSSAYPLLQNVSVPNNSTMITMILCLLILLRAFDFKYCFAQHNRRAAVLNLRAQNKALSCTPQNTNLGGL